MIITHIHSKDDHWIYIWAAFTTPHLSIIQHKVDNYLLNYYVPIIPRKLCTRKYQNYKDLRHKINIVDLRSKCNLLSIAERRDYFILKYAYKNLSHLKTGSLIRRTLPVNYPHNENDFLRKKRKLSFYQAMELAIT